MADDEQAEGPDHDWTVKLEKVQRVVPADSEESEDGNLFAVEFEISGPNMDAGVEVLVSDIADEAQVVTEALNALQDGLETWARVLGRRRGAGRIEPTGN